jgi:predicted RNA-binding protein with PIN domain
MFLIDGYNLIHALGMIQKSLPRGGLEASRGQLLDFLARAFGSETPQVTVVFDAKHAPRRRSRTQEHRGLTVRYAPKGQSADDLIETLIEETSRGRGLVVVSNDARLQAAAKRGGAKAWCHEALLDYFEKKHVGKPSASVDEKAVSMSAQEMKRWLQEFGGMEQEAEFKEFFEMDKFE